MYDLPENRRLVGACWFSGSLGVAILQMRLFAQVWQHGNHSAFIVALVSSAWLLGAFLSTLRHVESRAWGYALVACVFFWELASFIDWQRLALPYSYIPLATIVELAGAGLSFGWISTTWLNQSRPGWPVVGERWILAAALTCGTAGLVIVWMTVSNDIVSAVIGIVLLFPLLLQEARSPWIRPLPTPGTLAGRWQQRMQRGRGASAMPVHLDIRALPRGWWWTYLVARGRLALTLYASCLAIILGSMWAVLPTAYAGSLQTVHMSGKLPWLLGGQLCAFMIGISFLQSSARGVIGLPDRLLPASWRPQARLLACVAPFLMGLSLFALGYPTLQLPWELGVSLGVYTLAAMAWSVLLPRLRPSITTEIMTERHLYQQPAVVRILSIRQAEEAYVNRYVQTIGTALIILLTPIIGALIDDFTVDGVLLYIGTGLMIFVGIASVASFFRQLKSAPSLHSWIGGDLPLLPSGDAQPAKPGRKERRNAPQTINPA
jgi:hypothetical protein